MGKREVAALFIAALAASCAGAPENTQPLNSEKAFAADQANNLGDLLYLSRSAFEAARNEGDARAMARALAERPIVEDDEAGLIWQDVTRQLWDETFALASVDAETFRDVKEIFNHTYNDEEPHGNFSGVFGNLYNKPAVRGDARIVDLAPAENVALKQIVSASKGAIIYAEAPGLSGVSMKIIDEDAKVICKDASEHGFLICRWRPSERTTVRIVLENNAKAPRQILLVTNQ